MTNFDLQAIQAALDKNATIILMSWSFAGRLSSQERALMTDVLAIACDREVLVFCSAAEKGREDPTVFDNRLLCIGSTSDDPDAAGSSNIDFIFPSAADVKLHDDGHRRHYSDNTHALLQSLTDSRVSTALGTGLAATLLYLFKADELASMDQKAKYGTAPEVSHVLLAKPRYMKAAFKNLGKVTADGIIQIWETLGPIIKVLEDEPSGSERMMAKISSLCRNISHVP
jgi:hypothetical protein